MKRNLYLEIKNSLLLFWIQYPALKCAILFLSGIAFTFHWIYIFFAAMGLFFEKKTAAFLIFGAGYLYCLLLYPNPSLEKPVIGSGVFHIKELKRHRTPFHSLLVYEGILRTFQTEDQRFYRLPCHLYMPMKKNRPSATQDYFLSHVSLIEISPHRYLLKTQKSSLWTPIQKSKSQAEWRFQTKEKVRQWARKVFHQQQVQQLMTSLLTGQKESRLQTFQFGQIGLQHLLAISGFHFAILIFFLSFLLRQFLPRKLMALTLIILLSFYFYYMGEAPSISRAWIGILIFLGGLLLQRRSSPLNSMGVGLLAALIANPLIVLDVGFQLSFAATFSILIFYVPFESKLQRFFPRRSLKTLKQLPIWDQWGSLFSTYLRKTLALNASVILLTCPILLVHFHHFPLISLVYNLFFPLLFSLMIALLLFSMLFPFLIPLLEIYSSFLLHLITYAPKKLMFFLRFSEFPMEIACLFCFLSFLWGIHIQWSSSVIKEWKY